MAWGRIYKKGKNYYTDIIFQGQRKREKIGPKKDDAKKVLIRNFLKWLWRNTG